MLKFIQIIKQERTVSFFDHRVKVYKITAEYRGEDSESYRKSFEAKKDWPNVPTCGSHNELNNFKKQWPAN